MLCRCILGTFLFVIQDTDIGPCRHGSLPPAELPDVLALERLLRSGPALLQYIHISYTYPAL